MASLTDIKIQNAIAAAKNTGKDVWLTDATKARNVGRLRFRAMPSGNGAFLFRYNDSNGAQRHFPVGVYDPRGRAGYTLKTARDRAGVLSRRYQAGERDLHVHLAHERAEELARIEETRRVREEEERKARAGTLRALLDGYVAYLEKRGKQSAADARNIFKLNVYEAFAALAEMKASAFTRTDCNKILSKLIEAGKGRTAAKLRAYCRAAFSLALQADSDPTVPPALRGFELTANPWAAVPAKSFAGYSRALDRALNESELQAYMKALDALSDGMTKDALWLALLLGGQRPVQLLRVKPADVDLDGLTITLRDSKGARRQPRIHLLPLGERANELLSRVLETIDTLHKGKAAYVFTNDGKSHVRIETLSLAVTGISKAMVETKTARAAFTLRDIRRTCETQLAALGVSRDVRAQLLSHGLGGVQQQHYDRHAYMDEKREVLVAWDARLKDIEAGKFRLPAGNNVVPMKRARTRSRRG